MFAPSHSNVLVAALVTALTVTSVESHGYMYSPRSRNWVAHEDGVEYPLQDGVPKREYCHHCLNTNNGVCGASTNWDYDEWIDSLSNPMPWISQGSYAVGDTIRVKSYMSTHHNGHIEVKGCPDGRASTQDCFDDPNHILTFVSDPLNNMPADPNYPERGYLAGGNGGSIVDFDMIFKIPDGLVGDTVLIQWRYITANSCSPPGYSDYFNGGNSDGANLPSSYWNSGLGSCQPPYPQDGSRSSVWPEQFFNCAEVTITGEGTPTTSNPTPAPFTAPPVAPVAWPTYSPVTPVTPTSLPTEAPVSSPTKAPVPSPTASPPTGPPPSGNACCSHDFKTCITWCGSTESECFNCNSWDSYMWLPNGPETSCEARWGSCTHDSSACCPGLTCVFQNQWYSQCLP